MTHYGRPAVWVGILAIAGAALSAAPVRAQEDEVPADSNRFATVDSGVDTIDVSGYPEEMQASYKVVRTKCTQCHSFARVINSSYALPDEWKRYVKRMRRKPASGIKKKDAKAIWEFLVYDSKVRKAELIKEKTEAPEETSEEDQ